ncbi:U1 small nuclear ribonucleoprotein 70 kDa-like [Paramacrobiotus metropolitanus]|uniref:U1 small nuclear ribonucleoprotein 70 kDa-like n=1 Tax=Paramacrobiotus metropolitanus TaxID=2943436 RepID=UPI002445B1FC|nr:U1 small nuclear ribonucleoprotein 70 kDa-like [Paramacrobiotus metropolitanus]XP_055331794.1 U1 small nuclear ribonucleoprotein 70 kDa-like [Paramacrobiotus metropolitanus]XP_055331802.1 U1 small nuclear ribonucleoprotein 70 kDa-like [Paramacrobiotus metropolitanus]
MTAFLPPNLLALFAPGPPIPYLPPLDKASGERKRAGYHGIGAFLNQFEDPRDAPPPARLESREERRERKKRERQEMMTYKLEQELAKWNPSNLEFLSDPYKTLFVGRLNYDTSESKLKREFEQYGPVVSVKIVTDPNSGKSKGYGFVEFENERDMNSAYKYADGKRIDDRRVVVDVERGRTVKGWKPRRLGGGRGGRKTGATDPDKRRASMENERPAGGGPMRSDRDRDRNRDRGGPYQGPGDRSFDNRGPGGYGDRDRHGDRGGPMRDDRGGHRDRGEDRFRDRDDRNGYRDRDRNGSRYGGGGGGDDRDRNRRRY